MSPPIAAKAVPSAAASLELFKDCWGVAHPPIGFLKKVSLGGGLPVLALVSNHPVHGVLSQDFLDAI